MQALDDKPGVDAGKVLVAAVGGAVVAGTAALAPVWVPVAAAATGAAEQAIDNYREGRPIEQGVLTAAFASAVCSWIGGQIGGSIGSIADDGFPAVLPNPAGGAPLTGLIRVRPIALAPFGSRVGVRIRPSLRIGGSIIGDSIGEVIDDTLGTYR